jgi:hypothetical protein
VPELDFGVDGTGCGFRSVVLHVHGGAGWAGNYSGREGRRARMPISGVVRPHMLKVVRRPQPTRSAIASVVLPYIDIESTLMRDLNKGQYMSQSRLYSEIKI